ncbi:CpaF family protein [Lachnospiraceae bacterium ZAX-1]
MLDRIKKRIMNRLDMTREISDQEIIEIIDEEVCIYAKEETVSLAERKNMRNQVFYALRKLDILQELAEDDTITEIMVNGPDHIFFERYGKISRWDKGFSSKEKLEDIIQQIVGNNNRMVNTASPIVDTRLSDGSRVNVVLSPIAIDGACLSIRKFPKEPLRMNHLIEQNSIGVKPAQLLKRLVQAGYNIFVSGGTGSGKTTFLNALSEFIPKEERVITIEDSAELQIKEIENLVRLETRNANTQGGSEITMRDLIKTALRMRPSRIIVGEIRGAEALDMLQAMNTGHNGSLCTGHANNAQDMLSRIETMVLMGMELPIVAIRAQIAAGIDILVHLARMRDKSRRVVEITEVDRFQNGEIRLNSIYEFREIGENEEVIIGNWEQIGSLNHKEKLLATGIELE